MVRVIHVKITDDNTLDPRQKQRKSLCDNTQSMDKKTGGINYCKRKFSTIGETRKGTVKNL